MLTGKQLPPSRCLHGALLEALQQEARALEGGSGAAGDDVEMQDADAQGAPSGSAAAAGGTGGRRARVAVSSLTPAQQDRVVEQMVQGADIQLGLVNACVEVGAAWLVGGRALASGSGSIRLCTMQLACPVCPTGSAAALSGHDSNLRLDLGTPFTDRWSTTRTCAPASTPFPGPPCSWAACTMRWSCGRWLDGWGAEDVGRGVPAQAALQGVMLQAGSCKQPAGLDPDVTSELHSTLHVQGCDWVCDFTENGIMGAEGTVPGEQAALTDISSLT